MNPNIKIIYWTGKILYQGHYSSPEVDTVLDANRCACVADRQNDCAVCNESGYSGDFHVEWEDSSIDENAYKAINY